MDTIPSKQLHQRQATTAALKSVLSEREIGFCDADSTLYIKIEGELVEAVPYLEAIAAAKQEILEEVGNPLEWISDATVEYLNGTIPGLKSGWTYTLTDAGTLTAGNVSVEPGDEVAWSEVNVKWVKIGGDAGKVAIYEATWSSGQTTYPDASKIDTDITNGKHVIIRMTNSGIPTAPVVYYQLMAKLAAYQSNPKKILFVQLGSYGTTGATLTASYSNSAWSWSTGNSYPWLVSGDLNSTIAPAYNTSSTYNYPDVVVYNKTLYRCNDTGVTGTWDSTKWTAIHSMDVFSGSAPGLVPPATAGDASKALKGDGTWGTVSTVNVSYDSVNEELHLDFKDHTNEVLIGGRWYKTVTIGNQIWTAENLDYQWTGLTIGGTGSPTTQNAWYYNNSEADYGIDGTYKCGLLYNFYAASYLETNKTTLLPDGWHVPTVTELSTLVTAVGGSSAARSKLKALDNSVTSNWPSGWGGTDDYGFKALPGGGYFEGYSGINSFCYLWSSTSTDNNYARALYLSITGVNDQDYGKVCGFSLHLVKDIT